MQTKLTIKKKKNNDVRKRGIRPLGYYVMMWRKSDVTKSQIKAFEQRRFLDHNATPWTKKCLQLCQSGYGNYRSESHVRKHQAQFMVEI